MCVSVGREVSEVFLFCLLYGVIVKSQFEYLYEIELIARL